MSGEVAGRGVRRVLWVTLWLNLAVAAAKVLVGKLTGSLAMVADGYHSLVDGSNNVLGLLVAAFAYAPPDRGHPYGHRKFETAATVAIGGALLLLAWRLIAGVTAAGSRPAIGVVNWAVMLATVAINLFVSWYEAREGYTAKELKDRLRSGVAGVAKLDPRGPDPPLKMPGWGDRLSEKQLDDLVAYLLSLYPKEEASSWR